ncbi:Carboxylesterase 2 [Vibrio nigripulchritudo SO65]|uniref:alpha/beta hydrolase n=1 Tax=Vibrio nigripulchritudo TaxID=28173 RepID=UPI0003B1A4F1|nr:dienelactone hydrolase family protein [Vibrio nigripulchritudo]CCN38466.1 Carboxylesterase 2 [Vibrio nigripulchritudo AM115]CCN44244.1 Carboxylesterase 2 [Vibrio nigripulchritudo FTn2]CCN67728.1 Carboxylesterase 2 [Vibrio nigripulchritudo POn4]CCN76021.1 Carboxylesterase 2 [Vibrio nigripulchritudo SO65]
MLRYVEVEPSSEATASVIWLHGLGSNGHDFEAILPELKLPEDAPVRFIFPHSPSIPVTINGGMVMPAWYDILEMGAGRKLNAQQLIDSADQMIELVRQERSRGIASDRIILAGFSQGGAVAYQAALSYDEPLAGLLALSTYFPTSDSIEYSDANKQIPIEIMHGSYDPVVLPAMGEDARKDLTEAGYQPNWRTYPMEHQVCMPQIKDIAEWLTHTLKL